jgi:hypothetical protein
MLSALVIDPQEWTGRGVPAKVENGTNLQDVMQEGALSDIPTVQQWEAGDNAGLTGWALKPNKLTDPQTNLQWYGWAYGPVNPSQPGYCS